MGTRDVKEDVPHHGEASMEIVNQKSLQIASLMMYQNFTNVRRIPEPDRILETMQIKSTILYVKQLIYQD